ncbi:MAG: hypothetical protein HC841_03225, partial [Verrucomicrobiae bacterium]|nr:hypothetical protein [Verrucomicrobiae bacterium]
MSNAAAADAAREARAEVEAMSPTAPAKSGAKPAAAKAGWYTFDARVWITDFNPVEFG